MTQVHFYKGDILKAINVLDEDGEPCDGGLKMGELVMMDDRSSEYRPFIIVTRENGRQYQWDKTRFELHQRANEEFEEIPPVYLHYGVGYQSWINSNPATSYRMGKKINLYGDEKSYKPFPDLSEIPEEDPYQYHGGKAVILSINSGEHVREDEKPNNALWDLITSPAMPDQNVLDYMAGKISLEECEIRSINKQKEK